MANNAVPMNETGLVANKSASDLCRSFASHHGSLAEALACEICAKHGPEFCEFIQVAGGSR